MGGTDRHTALGCGCLLSLLLQSRWGGAGRLRGRWGAGGGGGGGAKMWRLMGWDVGGAGRKGRGKVDIVQL